MYCIELKNIKLEGDLKDYLVEPILNKACTLCPFIKLSVTDAFTYAFHVKMLKLPSVPNKINNLC